MAYDQTTQNYGLPQWKANDKPERRDFNEAFAAVDTQLSNKENKAKLAEWFDLPLQNGFAPWSGLTPQYCKIGQVVYLRGSVQFEQGKVPMETTFATLPEGFRPYTYHWFLAPLSQYNGGGYVRVNLSMYGEMKLNYSNNPEALDTNFALFLNFVSSSL